MTRDDFLRYSLAGTVSFPPTFPQVGRVTLELTEVPSASVPGGKGQEEFIVVFERASLRVELERRIKATSVKALFIPQNCHNVTYNEGRWLLGEEVLQYLRTMAGCGHSVYGIVYVQENEPTTLLMKAGMAAAESAQYYPPLPIDRGVNHYDPTKPTGTPVANTDSPSTTRRRVADPEHLEPFDMELMLAPSALRDVPKPQGCKLVTELDPTAPSIQSP